MSKITNIQPETISCKEMYQNPTGKGSGFVAARYRIRDSMRNAFIANLRAHRFKFVAQPYIGIGGEVIFWVKVPSRSYDINRIAYDVVIDIPAGAASLDMRPAKFFCNSPSFIFTYCYVFAHKDLIIPWMEDRLPEQALNNPPVVRNPIQSLGYELILYQALSYLIEGGCLTDNYVSRYGIMWTPKQKLDIQAKVSDPETLIQIYQTAQTLERKNHRKVITPNQLAAKKKVIKDFSKTEGYRTPLKPKPKLFAKSAHAKLTAHAVKAKMKKKGYV